MSNSISCKKFYGLNGTSDLREKLILDYEKLYYRIYEIELYNKHYRRED